MSKPINSRVLEGNFLVAGVRVVGGEGRHKIGCVHLLSEAQDA